MTCLKTASTWTNQPDAVAEETAQDMQWVSNKVHSTSLIRSVAKKLLRTAYIMDGTQQTTSKLGVLMNHEFTDPGIGTIGQGEKPIGPCIWGFLGGKLA